jgi:sRNA-binding carbon storage regulator CsrA
MLVITLSSARSEYIEIEGGIKIYLSSIKGKKVRIGIDADKKKVKIKKIEREGCNATGEIKND